MGGTSGNTINYDDSSSSNQDNSLKVLDSELRSQRSAFERSLFRSEFEYRFFEVDPADVLLINAQTGSANVGNDPRGFGYFRTGATAGSVLDIQTPEPVRYSARHSSFYDGSFLYISQPTGTGVLEAGAFTDSDGYFFRVTASGLYIVYRVGGVDTEVALGSQNGDPLDGSTDSEYTSNGVPVAVTLQNFQVAEIKGAWRGVDSFNISLLSPDKKWVLLHSFRYLNEGQLPSLTNPELPMRIRVANGDASEDLEIRSNCWSAGTDNTKLDAHKIGSNSTRTPLAKFETFTGAWVSAKHLPYLRVAVESNTTGTLTIQWSDDGSTVHESSEPFEYDDAEGQMSIPEFKNLREFVRVVYTNDNVDQTLFNLDVYLDSNGTTAVPIAPRKQNTKKSDPVVVTKANLAVNGNDVNAGNPVNTQIENFPAVQEVNEGEDLIIPLAFDTAVIGDSTVITPTAGSSIRLWWYNISAHPDSTATNVVSMAFGANTPFYKTALSQYGAATAHSFKAGKSYYQGGVDESLVVNLSAAQRVYVNIDYEEV